MQKVLSSKSNPFGLCENWMVSMTTYKIILKNGRYLQIYSYLSSNSPKNTKLGIKLILNHRIFSVLSSMQIISFEYSEYL